METDSNRVQQRERIVRKGDLNKSKLPDFLVIGAAKAGTTALFKALGRHPSIFCSPKKEPGFLAFEGQANRYTDPWWPAKEKRLIFNKTDYLRLFAQCPEGAKAGEASTRYLSSLSAPACAARYMPHARLVAILRHPVERGYSQWLHLRQEGQEPLANFEAAWLAEKDRIAQGWQSSYEYRLRGFYAEALEEWLRFFPREQLLILFYEDWKQSPQECLRQVWRHLGVPEIENPVVTQENVSSRQPRWPWLQHRMTENNALRRWAQRVLPLAVRDTITASVQAVNLVPGPRLDPALRAKLAATYHDDLRKVESLTGRDLASWRQ